jgi:hypothetical protein
MVSNFIPRIRQCVGVARLGVTRLRLRSTLKSHRPVQICRFSIRGFRRAMRDSSSHLQTYHSPTWTALGCLRLVVRRAIKRLCLLERTDHGASLKHRRRTQSVARAG